ncbi:ricin-type beta-trefoil lectin domain protein [Streptomyces sp. NPDC003011]
MSDQQQASEDSSARKAVAATPDAESVEARLTGAGEPSTASAPEGSDAGRAAASEAAAGADTDEGIRPARSTGRPKAGAAASGPAGDAGNAEGTSTGEKAEEATDTQRAEVTAQEPESGEATAGEEEKGDAGKAQGEGATERDGARELSAAAATGQRKVTATAVDGGGATSASGSGLGRPRKPVLAGAAIAGALLITVPLLITATGKDEERKAVDTAAADTVLDEADGPAGVFVTQSPSPSPTKPKTKTKTKSDPEKKKEEKKEKESASPVAEKAAAPAPAASPSPSGEKKAVVKKAPSNLPAVLTRVLIKNNTNRTCVDIPGFTSGPANGPVTQATCNSNTDDNQLWNVEKRYDKAGPGGVPLFQIRNVMDSMCLDLPGYQGVGGATKVTEFPCDGTTKDNQLWWLDKQSDGTFWIRNAASNNQCLDSYAPDDATRDLIVWPCAPESQNNHEWIFTRS